VRGHDWGDAPSTAGFVGRADELEVLRSYVVEERSRLVAILGMGGIGKTSLATRLAQDVATSFERVYWRSLRDAPPVSDWLAGAIGFLSDQELVPPSESDRLPTLLKLLRERRCLLVLDNFETLFEPGQEEALYRPGLDGYGHLLLAVGEAAHQSCLVLTSREAPEERAVFHSGEGRKFHLGGLGAGEAQTLLAPKQLTGTTPQWAELTARVGGNGLALKLVGETIHERFGGEIGPFLDSAGAGSIFEGMRQLVAEQVERGSASEHKVLRCLAIEREPLTMAGLLAAIGARMGRAAGVEAVEALRRRSLVERAETPGPPSFTLQSVVLEYITDRLVEDVADEIERSHPLLLVEHPLIKAHAKEYVRQTQERLIGMPILRRLTARQGEDGTERRLLALLGGWRARPAAEQEYGPGNVVNLLRLLRGDLRGQDFSRLALRQAYLAQVDAQDARLVDAHLAETVLAEAFDFPGTVALSGDGALLAAGTSTGEVWLWRVADRTAQWAVQSHTGAVRCVALTADGQLVASGGADGTVRLWETDTGRPLVTLRGHTGMVYSVALSADSRLVASGGADGTVRLWETGTGRSLFTLEAHTSTVYSVALSADGRLVASGSADGTVRLWETGTDRPPFTLDSHTGEVRGVALSADGRFVVSGGRDKIVRLWETDTGRLLATLRGHAGAVWGVALSADGRLVASGGAEGTTRLWGSDTGRPLATLQGHIGTVYGVALSADSRLVASGGGDGAVRLWETQTGRPLTTLQGQTGAVWGVALSADSRLVASGGGDGAVRLWETQTGRPVTTMEGHIGTVYSVALSADGRLVASGGEDGTVRLRETGTGRAMTTLQGRTGGVWGVALSADGRLVASGGGDGTTPVWDAGSGRPLATPHGDVGTAYCVALSANGQLVATGGFDGTVRLWETGTGRPLGTLQGCTGTIRGVALSADGRLVASGGGDGIVRLWETDTGRSVTTLRGHTGGVWGLALSADGRLVASGSADGTVRLWETGTGRPVATLQRHTGMVWGVSLSADGGLLASGGFDGTVRLWESTTGTCLRVLRPERRYERMDVTGLTGVTAAQRGALLALGAVDEFRTSTNGE
jgi:WD40 repeat protein